jgi:hypothetical protein
MNNKLLLISAVFTLIAINFIASPSEIKAIMFSSHDVTLSENMTKAKEELKTLCGPIKIGITPPTEAMINNASYEDMMNYLDTCTTDIVGNNYHYGNNSK